MARGRILSDRIKARIKKLNKETDLTQEEIAEVLRITHNSVSRILNPKGGDQMTRQPKPSTL